MRIAIAGKGGTGKTTITGTLARLIARQGRNVVAVDADTNPNLAVMLGIARDQAQELIALPTTFIERQVADDGTVTNVFVGDPEYLVAEYGVTGPDGVRLITMGAVEHAGKGCHCRAHATVRGFISELVEQPDQARDVIVDMEAGLEHISRGTARGVTRFVTAIEPYYRSMETARRVAELARELGIRDVVGVANKLRDDGDRDAVRAFCAAHNIELIAEVPYDASVLQAERAGSTPLDYDPNSPAVVELRQLAERMVRE